jgi:small-conductance mechanosensitive channel
MLVRSKPCRLGTAFITLLLAAFCFASAVSCFASIDRHAEPDRQAQPDRDAQPPAAPVQQAPVVVDGVALFQVPGFLSFPAQARAAAIAKRITELSRQVAFNPKSLSVSDAENTTDILAGDLVIMSVTNQDAQTAAKPRHQLAQDYADLIARRLVALQRQYSVKSLIFGGIYAFLATAILVLILRVMAVFLPKLYKKIDLSRQTRIPSLRIQDFELLPADRIADFAIGFIRLLRFAAVLVAFYFYLFLVLGFFPWTRAYSGVLLGYVVSPLKTIGDTVLAYLPNLFFIAVIVVVAHYIIKFVGILFAEVGKGTVVFSGFHAEWAAPTYKIVRFLLFAITAIAAFPYLPGSKSPAFQGMSIFLGVLISLGSTSAVANIVAGVILTYMRAFRLGDRVQIADTIGDVVEISLLVTRIRTIKNVEITIANSMVLSSHIVNFSGSVQPDGLILHTTVTIGYDAPWRKIHELLVDAACTTADILDTPAPFVLQTALDDFYVHYQINAYTDKPGKMAMTYSALHQNIQDKFFEAGVEIMSSHFSTIREGNRVAIPDDYLPKDYKVPSFRVALEKDFGGPQDASKGGS